MPKIIRSNNHTTKKKCKDSTSSILSVLSKLPLEIISIYPHKSLYRCFSAYLRKNPSIILKVQESKSIYHAWRMNEAQRRKMLRNQKRNSSVHKRERKYTYNNLYKDFEYCYDDDKDNQADDYHESQMNKVKGQLLSVNEKIDEKIDEPIDEPIDELINEPIDEEKFKEKIREQIEEINNDIAVYLDSEYEVHNFIHDYIPL